VIIRDILDAIENTRRELLFLEDMVLKLQKELEKKFYREKSEMKLETYVVDLTDQEVKELEEIFEEEKNKTLKTLIRQILAQAFTRGGLRLAIADSLAAPKMSEEAEGNG